MAGEGSHSTDDKSIRRRLTTSIKKVINMGRRGSRSSAAASGPETPSAAASPTTSGPPVASIARPTPEEKIKTKPYRPPKNPTPAPPVLSPAERAQALFKKHGLEITTSEWPLSDVPQGERVQKDIRMRVHRTCHKCSTPYGAERVCTECNHKRCKKCPRFPVKKPKDKGKEKEKEVIPEKPHFVKKKKDYSSVLTLPSRTGGQDLVRKQIRQRVHRSCHRCGTDFAGEKVCSSCKHNRCKNCPREPFKQNKPPGYYDGRDPDDSGRDEPIFRAPPRRTYKKPRRRVHWTCAKCSGTFKEKTKTCDSCGSNRDDTGLRDPPKKPKHKTTEQDLKRLEERLKLTSLSAA
ncbi:hypothetical protein RUND412_003064 [Rhizina undulata]